MIYLVFKHGKRIFVPNDEHDDAKRADLNTERDKLKSLIGAITCPHGLQLCDVNIAICEDKFLEVTNVCHKEYITLIEKHLEGSGYCFRKLTV
ncbi:MAG: hypothetical protein HY707_13920 [Ignavibacteriae bacterium]|nr:hypothetical protein [Ignavibacteriota bacterium]